MIWHAPKKSIVTRLHAIVKSCPVSGGLTSDQLAIAVLSSKIKRIKEPFKYTKKGKPKIVTAIGLKRMINFAKDLKLLEEKTGKYTQDSSITIASNVDDPWCRLLASRVKTYLNSLYKLEVDDILKSSYNLIKNYQLPTSILLYGKCKHYDLKFREFGYCLEILSREPSGSLARYTRRLFVRR